jgi:hypothetical protein
MKSRMSGVDLEILDAPPNDIMGPNPPFYAGIMSNIRLQMDSSRGRSSRRRQNNHQPHGRRSEQYLVSAPDKGGNAVLALFELFSKPTKSPAKAHRTYQLTFENGEPIFTLSEADRILEVALGKLDPGTIRKEPAAILVKTAKQFRSLA